MSRISKPYTFVNNTQTADGTQVNANFDALFNDYNGNVTSDNFATNGFSDSTKLAKEVVTQAKTQGVVYTQDLFSAAFVQSGGVATKDGTTANILDVTAIVAYTLQSDGSLRRISNPSTTFTTNVVSTTYYLDLNPDGSWWWGTAHTSQQNYLAIAQVTTDASGNISGVTDKRTLAVVLKAGNHTVLSDGDYTTRSAFFVDQNTTTQSITASTWTKVLFDTVVVDNLTEWDATNKRFVAKKKGIYLFSAGAGLASVADGTRLTSEFYINGGANRRVEDFSTGSATSIPQGVYGTGLLWLNAGDYVDFMVFSSVAVTTALGSDVTYLSGIQIA